MGSVSMLTKSSQRLCIWCAMLPIFAAIDIVIDTAPVANSFTVYFSGNRMLNDP